MILRSDGRILLCILVGIFGVVAERSLNAKDEEEVIALWMPRVNTTSEDEYYCMGVNTEFDVRYISEYNNCHVKKKSLFCDFCLNNYSNFWLQ